MTQITLEPVVNKNFFSNHYLENLIQRNIEWKSNEHELVYDKIKKIYQRELVFLEGLNESQLEKRFFREIFKILLQDFEVQATSVNLEFPDYAFFPNKQSLDDAHKEKGKKSFYTGAFAVGEVKRWDVELDKFGKDKHNKRRNPSFQIWLYLHETEPRWGILSNGRKWRLYHQDKPLDCYFEIDLVSLLENDDMEGFRYFYYFFRREAYVPNEKGDIFLEQVLRESADYAKEIGDNLKENVYRAMKIISDGFLHWPQNNLDYTNEEVRMEVQKSTMRLLYRLLFLLYAEGKGLLDLSDELYRNSYSFYRLKMEITNKKEGARQDTYLPASTTLWGRLKDLFRLIDQGSESFGIPKDQFYVPAYNGGLFEAEKNPHLEKWTIGDTYLADAIDLLARSETKEGKAYVDYSTLEIRHLGSIYEGLLEYKLKIAEEDLVVQGTKKKEWVTLDEFNKGKKTQKSFDDFESFDRVKKGEIYLATDKGERKATGSYYTPDYIVNYIVENTVGSVVQDRWKEAKKNNMPLVEATLATTVLDPAMGSGHFLVGAVEYLAARLLEAVQRDIENGLITDDGHYTPDWAKREVISHCVYGVDLNEMAVELGKLSLWLSTISKDKPLSFLDHRLKCGNSLIGADLTDLPWHPDSKTGRTQKRIDIPTGFIQKLVDTVNRLASIDDDTLEHVREKERIFQEFKDTREYDMIKTLADVRTSIHFGNQVEQGVYGNYTGDAYYSSEGEWKQRREKPFAQKARQTSEQKRFFHWELEFPEIFFKEGTIKENPGFDVVIGNPPYVREEAISADTPYLRVGYSELFDGKADIYVYFFGLSIKLLQSSGIYGIIVSNKWNRSKYGLKLRTFIKEKTRIVNIIDFGELSVFEDAGVFPQIIILDEKLSNEHGDFVQIKSLPIEESLYSVILPENIVRIVSRHLEKYSWSFESSVHLDIGDKLKKNSKKLNEYFGVTNPFLVGIKTGRNSAFIMSKEKVRSIIKDNNHEEQLFKKYLVGDDIQKYFTKESQKYILFPYDCSNKDFPLVNLDEYPKVKDYLLSIKSDLESRAIIKDKIKTEPNMWYSLQQLNKNIDISLNKIIYPDIGKELRFTMDEEGYYIDMTGFILETDDLYLLSVLNSKLTRFQLNSICAVLGDVNEGGRLRFKSQYMEHLMIRDIENISPDETALILSCLKKEYLNLDVNRILARFMDEKTGMMQEGLRFLSRKMLDMNKEKNKEISGFLSWLETELQASIEDLTNKTQIKEYYKLPFNELLKILKKNDKKIPINPSDRGFQENLKREYEKSVNTLSPLFDKIEKTDWLIDQIVYKLYGLSEEEIQIVEEAVG